MKAPHKIIWIRMFLCFFTGGFFFELYPYCDKCYRNRRFDHIKHNPWEQVNE